jgi:hypothetical protein
MKRTITIISWTIAFAVVTWLIGFIAFPLLASGGYVSSSSSTQMAITMIWLVLFFSMPVLGLVLGLLGKLPGTKKSKS